MRAKSLLPFIGAGLVLALAACGPKSASPPGAPPAAGSAEFLEHSPDAHWRALDPENTLYMQLPAGRVVIELNPDYAPTIVGNVKKLVRENYFDGSAVIRAQDNYVVQWARPEDAPHAGPYTAQTTMAPEFVRRIADNIEFTALSDPDTYAPEVGFSKSFPVARNPQEGVTWMAHCYGMVGVGRDVDENSGAGQELYAVIGNAPRHLDRNVTLIGRVVKGMELLSTMRRGAGQLGFYDNAAERTPIASIRVAADVPAVEREHLQVLRSDSPTFATLIESRRNRTDDWFKYQVGKIELCNVPLPVREKK
jgi:cyclophilin family peptidyl-prolyl cis-trans isomerase